MGIWELGFPFCCIYNGGKMKIYKVDPLGQGRYSLGESPFFDKRTGLISFVDITQGRFYRMRLGEEPIAFDAGQKIGAAVPCENPGEYIFCAEDGLYLFADEKMTKIQDLSAFYEKWQRSNDAKFDPAGRLFFGSSSDDDEHGANGNLFCYDKNASEKIRLMQKDTKISNGMAWNSAKNRFFFSDSLEYAVFSYDYELSTGDISKRKVLFTVENGVPDGMCIDSNDNLYLAVWGGHRIEIHKSSGEILGLIEVPAKNVTSCCFIDEQTLFITSSGDGQSGEYDGSLFTCRL